MPESAGPPITFDAATYDELYAQVSARASLRKEAGSVTTQLTTDTVNDATGNPTEVKLTAPLVTSLPAWPQQARQPAADQAKYTAWYASVDAHERTHRDLYRREYAKLRTSVIGPTARDVDAQAQAIVDAAELVQDAFDARSQPAPLAAPGGIEQVPRRNGGAIDSGISAASADPAPYDAV
jgi:hypothetical protein